MLNDKRKKIFIYLLIIALAAAGNFYLYYANSRPPADTLDLDDYAAEDPGNVTLGQNTSGQDFILEHELYARLRKVGDWPIVPEKIGRPDPFAPAFLD